MDNYNIAADAGFSKPYTTLSMKDREEIGLHHSILKCKAELDDMRRGLDVLGVGEMMEKYPEILTPFFTAAGVQHITAGIDMHTEFWYTYSTYMHKITAACQAVN